MFLPICAAVLTMAAVAPPIDEAAVIALVMVDRYADGADNADDVVPGHPRRFQGGDLPGLRARLAWLQALGVSHVWMTPLHAQIPTLVGTGDTATAGFHGYWPADFTAIDPHFGTVADLRALADDAAAKDIGLVLDVVTNHTGYGAPDPRHLVREQCGDDETTSCLFGLPDLKTEDPRVRAAVVDDVAWWLRQAPVAGVRLDAFKHLDAETARAITTRVRRERPGAVVIAERWGASPGDAAVRNDVDSGAADAAFDFGLMGLARDFVTGRMRGAATAHHLTRRAEALANGPPMLTFLDNHDTETWAHATGERAPLGAPLLLLTPGIPVITWGTEVGRRGGAGDPENRTMIAWADADRAAADATDPLHFWRRLVALRRTSPAARRGTFRLVASSPTSSPSWIVWERQHERERILVAVAVDGDLLHCEPPGAADDVIEVIGWPASAALRPGLGQTCLQVPAGGALVVRRQRPNGATLAP